MNNVESRDEIIELSTRGQARDVSVWFGTRENFMHPLKEMIANSIDEISNNFDSGRIMIDLSDDCKKIKIRDSGRGIPIEGVTNGKENYKSLLLTLFAGTNYKNKENGKMTTGTHGLGLTVSNYCSKYLRVTSYRPDGVYSISFQDGGDIKEELKKSKNSNNEHGTEIEFILDDEVFTSTTYNKRDVLEIVKNLSGIAPHISIMFSHMGEVQEFTYESLEEYFNEIALNRTCKTVCGYEKEYTLDGERNIIQLMMSTSSDPVQRAYLNITYLSEGGFINKGIAYGVRDFVNKNQDGKKDKEVTYADVVDSISFVCNFMSNNVEFTNQTKFSTNKSLYQKIARMYTIEILEVYKNEEPTQYKKFVDHILEVQKFNNKAETSKKALKKKLTEKIDTINNRVEGLFDSEFHGEGCEIFITEGKSALGSIIPARNPDIQAGIAIRGKILNCLKATYTKIFGNTEVMGLMRALGCGIETDAKNKDLGCFDKSKLRYERIILAMDADPDGYQIICLLLTMFYRLTPTLIREGHIYIALTPLFEIKDLKTDKCYYAYTDEEKDEIVSKLPKYKVNRNKGLGEIDADVMAKTGVNPETRNILKVTFDDAEAMVKAFDEWMDDDVTYRKMYIENELNKYNND